MITIPRLGRPGSAWAFLQDVVGALTHPPADTALCDRRVEALARDSLIARPLLAVSRAGTRAARDSAVIRLARRGLAPLAAASLRDRVRAAGVVAASAAATVLSLRAASTEYDPFSWVLPAAAGAAGLVAIAAADAIARAMASHRS